jgi:molybdopterin converting factor small subunit
MSVQVYIPTPFRRATGNADRVAVEAPDVKALLDELEEQFGALKGLVRNDQGEVHHHVNIYVNDEAIEALQGLDTALRDGVSIIPALAGGGPALAGGGPVLAGG